MRITTVYDTYMSETIYNYGNDRMVSHRSETSISVIKNIENLVIKTNYILRREREVCVPLVFNKSIKKKDKETISGILSRYDNKADINRLEGIKIDLNRYRDLMNQKYIPHHEINHIITWLVSCDTYLKNKEEHWKSNNA